MSLISVFPHPAKKWDNHPSFSLPNRKKHLVADRIFVVAMFSTQKRVFISKGGNRGRRGGGLCYNKTSTQ